jgi:hypothetical protein
MSSFRGDMRNAYNILIGTPEGKIQFEGSDIVDK